MISPIRAIARYERLDGIMVDLTHRLGGVRRTSMDPCKCNDNRLAFRKQHVAWKQNARNKRRTEGGPNRTIWEDGSNSQFLVHQEPEPRHGTNAKQGDRLK